MIMARIIKQMKFQFKHNKHDFLGSARISLVLLLQNCLNLVVLFVEFAKNAYFEMYYLFESDNEQCTGMDCAFNPVMNVEFPLWLDDRLGVSDPMSIQTLRQIRVLVESVIVLGIMTGYREALIKAFKFAYNFIKNPRPSDQKKKPLFTRSKVSFVS